MSIPWRVVARYNIFDAQAANWTSTKKINWVDYRNIIVRVWTAENANLTLKVKWAILTEKYPDAPDFNAAQTVANNWDTIEMIYLNWQGSVKWDTWLVLTWTDTFKLFELNTNALEYISFTVSWYVAWSITVDVLLTDNK